MNVYPTHECFDDAIHLIIMLIKHTTDNQEAILVHSICKMPDGTLYSHAWVENKNHCIFKGIVNGEGSYFAASMEDYYEHIMPQEITKYTFGEAMKECLLTDNSGPWKPHYRVLCKDFDFAHNYKIT